MAKRARGSRSAHRPGGQGPNRARKPADAGSPTPPDVDDVLAAQGDWLGSAEVEVDEVAAAAVAAVTASPEEAPTPVAARPSAGRRASRRTSKRRVDEELSARAAAEDAWVRADLRRIIVISAILFVILAAAWIVFGALDVFGLY